MRRRDFIKGVSGSAITWPLTARAQQPALPVVGFLGTTTPNDFASRVAAFREGLKEVGYVEGQNVVIEYRWPEGNYDRLAMLAADLVHRRVAVIAAVGGDPSPVAAKAATSTIPIVFSIGGDPVRLGLVANLNRPGGNITGVSFLFSELGAKRLGLLHELLPKASVIGMLVNPTFADAETYISDTKEAALPLGLQIHAVKASTAEDFDTAFAALAEQKTDALLLANDAFFLSERRKLIALAARCAIPAVYFFREFVVDGGLMSYSPSLTQVYRQVGIYTGKILNGANPADLPFEEPTHYKLVVNLKIAKATGIELPVNFLALADEVIE